MGNKTFVVSLAAEEAQIVLESSRALNLSQCAVIRAAVRLMRQIAEQQAKVDAEKMAEK